MCSGDLLLSFIKWICPFCFVGGGVVGFGEDQMQCTGFGFALVLDIINSPASYANTSKMGLLDWGPKVNLLFTCTELLVDL